MTMSEGTVYGVTTIVDRLGTTATSRSSCRPLGHPSMEPARAGHQHLAGRRELAPQRMRTTRATARTSSPARTSTRRSATEVFHGVGRQRPDGARHGEEKVPDSNALLVRVNSTI